MDLSKVLPLFNRQTLKMLRQRSDKYSVKFVYNMSVSQF